MDSQRTNAHLTACRRLAMEPNKKHFEEANTLNRTAINLLLLSKREQYAVSRAHPDCIY
ncbi:hypothetical protein [Pseudomonas sp. FP1740]|uniref:hypothetical protein n=1 Tax=Pseudomonas sp. FP1740 TaxID=2954078 RepID=UPI0027327C39|nr:hypothetical protein [Pseudomonas sp. FP1740]WLG47242.1 hypothetical protein PSH69_11775 [Pseudomonas sp. FP1740]